MTNPVVLNNVTHKDLRINTRHTRQNTETQMIALALPFEFRSLQHEYPIVFYQDEQQRFHAVVLLGLEQSENLYVTDEGWEARYVPLMIQRQPFLIGQRPADESGERQTVLLVDTDSPKLSDTEGEPLFLPHGGHSEYLQQITDILSAIQERDQETLAFINTLLEYELLENFYLDVNLSDGSKHRLNGYYTINEDKLRALNNEQVIHLHQSGMLQLIHFVLASQANFAGLIEKKQARLSE